MCGRYVLFSSMEQIASTVAQHLPQGPCPQTVQTQELQPNFNVAPTHVVPIIRLFQGVPTVGPAQWGYPPRTVFNARGETLKDKPLFAGSLPCAFVMDGWYEWTGERGEKQPWFTHRADEQPLIVAGLCTVREGVLYATIVTCAAVPELEWLHHRMPRLLLGEGELDAWLQGEDWSVLATIDAEAVAHAGLTSRKASRQVGSVRNNSPALIGWE
ncbi:SOS response-associated peptidase [Corynebacterium sp. 320]|uniref:SOS response-associated peptidase n=1 Tax=Corynebacterium TaxID=1716 RepID=UPI00125CBE45|nr:MULTISPECIES: SOS response-associated peptidase [Corynebacterium]KAB1504158.1 SOS response-associated peptidase [Corynebacterium sp. 320]KAB1552742.1 SOS response-associated peptidase [Corynebacterium sp. 321]KAB1554040.1 SOS response-associated peptidase [Corynebacterium sp. 319]KAB3528294.1 SOS response-associated peptidase [Corynebacterium sp. 250]KAB3540217.1 SOS response-associated peptidase [Corynebacterium sp. 366]